MKQGYCAKCKKFNYLHKRHVLPKATFGGEGDTYYLCPNCHWKIDKKIRKSLTNQYL